MKLLIDACHSLLISISIVCYTEFTSFMKLYSILLG